MIRIAVCDDEPEAGRLLKDAVARQASSWEEPAEISCFTKAAELLDLFYKYDIVLLDIRMPGLDGISLARRLREQGFGGALIFVTALGEHMGDAFEVEAVDYLCKPLEEARLSRALLRARRRLEGRMEKRLFICTAKWKRVVRLGDIYYCEIINRKLYLHTKNGVVEYYGRIREAEQELVPPFIKCHRSYLVNPEYLIGFAGGELTLENGEQLPVSRQRRQELLEAMLHYMAGRDS